MFLTALLQSQKNARIIGNPDIVLSALVDDSRLACPDACYIAVKGHNADGHDYILASLKEGASCIIAERTPTAEEASFSATWVILPNTEQALPQLAKTWYHNPSQDMKIVGVTGTNGKTTTTFILHSIFTQCWHKAGLIGTVHYDDGDHLYEATNTTPGAIKLQALLAQMTLNDCRGIAMEVSSHALTQNRVDAVEFDVGIFTNLTQDHLDYHKDMESYYAAKRILFEKLVATTEDSSSQKKPVGLINSDSPAGERLVADFSNKLNVKTYGFSPHADFKAVLLKSDIKGCEFELQYNNKAFLVKSPLIGRFNVYNALAALAGSICAGVPAREAVQAMEHIPQVPGRLEYVGIKEKVMGFVDYAHTPDALENVCKTLKELTPGRLITIFGCGGDRDTKKRPLMGDAASQYSDMCIITSDNPRSEDPEAIIRQILPGVRGLNFRTITDRKEAIRVAVDIAKPGDVILLAGKGHEDYQELADGKIYFDDKVALRMAIENIGPV